MVRAGVVNHPGEWAHAGYHEIQEPPKRYATIDLRGLSDLCGFGDAREFRRAHRRWVEHALEDARARRDDRWSEAIAVGSLAFVEKIKSELGFKAAHREFEPVGEGYALRESGEPYARNFGGKTGLLRLENTMERKR